MRILSMYVGNTRNMRSREDNAYANSIIKDVRGWQFLTMKAAETLCIVCLPPEEHIS